MAATTRKARRSTSKGSSDHRGKLIQDTTGFSSPDDLLLSKQAAVRTIWFRATSPSCVALMSSSWAFGYSRYLQFRALATDQFTTRQLSSAKLGQYGTIGGPARRFIRSSSPYQDSAEENICGTRSSNPFGLEHSLR